MYSYHVVTVRVYTNAKAFVILPGPNFYPGYGIANVDKCLSKHSAVSRIEPTTFEFHSTINTSTWCGHERPILGLLAYKNPSFGLGFCSKLGSTEEGSLRSKVLLHVILDPGSGLRSYYMYNHTSLQGHMHSAISSLVIG